MDDNSGSAIEDVERHKYGTMDLSSGQVDLQLASMPYHLFRQVPVAYIAVFHRAIYNLDPQDPYDRSEVADRFRVLIGTGKEAFYPSG